MARQIGDQLLECGLGVEIGNCQLTLGQAPAALAELTAARQIARTFGARHLVSEATRGIAEAELSLGRSVEARNEARSAYEIAEHIGSPPLAGAALRVAATSVGRGAPGDPDLGGAREMFDRAVQILGDAGAELELGRALSAYADFEERTGRTDAATELRRQTDLIIDRARRPGRTRQSQEMAVITFEAALVGAHPVHPGAALQARRGCGRKTDIRRARIRRPALPVVADEGVREEFSAVGLTEQHSSWASVRQARRRRLLLGDGRLLEVGDLDQDAVGRPLGDQVDVGAGAGLDEVALLVLGLVADLQRAGRAPSTWRRSPPAASPARRPWATDPRRSRSPSRP